MYAALEEAFHAFQLSAFDAFGYCDRCNREEWLLTFGYVYKCLDCHDKA